MIRYFTRAEISDDDLADLGLASHGTVQSWFNVSYTNLRWPNIFNP